MAEIDEKPVVEAFVEGYVPWEEQVLELARQLRPSRVIGEDPYGEPPVWYRMLRIAERLSVPPWTLTRLPKGVDDKELYWGNRAAMAIQAEQRAAKMEQDAAEKKARRERKKG